MMSRYHEKPKKSATTSIWPNRKDNEEAATQLSMRTRLE